MHNLKKEKDLIVYEHPCEERIRTLLRLEDLYEKFMFFLYQESPLQHHIALSTIFDILEITWRVDLKSDLLQELERQKQNLLAYQSNPQVESIALSAILNEIDRASSALVSVQGKIGQTIRDNEWLMNIRKRISIPGGACEFDLPSYFAWQKLAPEQRFDDISNWFRSVAPLFDGINLIMRLLRESAQTAHIYATNGSYQQSLHGKTCQLLRLTLDEKLKVIPEISANKYILWVHFARQDNSDTRYKVKDDIPFALALCDLR